MLLKEETLIKRFVEGNDRDHYLDGERYELYFKGLADNEYALIISNPRKSKFCTEIRFRNVSRQRPESAFQFDITSYKETKDGKVRTINNSFSIPVEMVDEFIQAIQSDRSNV